MCCLGQSCSATEGGGEWPGKTPFDLKGCDAHSPALYRVHQLDTPGNVNEHLPCREVSYRGNYHLKSSFTIAVVEFIRVKALNQVDI